MLSVTLSSAQEMISVPLLYNFIVRESGQWQAAQEKEREERTDDSS